MSAPMRTLWLFRWLPPLRKRYPQSKAAARRQRQATLTYDASDRVASLSAPTLILHGRRDRTVPVELACELANQIPGAQLTLFRGGHMFSSSTSGTRRSAGLRSSSPIPDRRPRKPRAPPPGDLPRSHRPDVPLKGAWRGAREPAVGAPRVGRAEGSTVDVLARSD